MNEIKFDVIEDSYQAFRLASRLTKLQLDKYLQDQSKTVVSTRQIGLYTFEVKVNR